MVVRFLLRVVAIFIAVSFVISLIRQWLAPKPGSPSKPVAGKLSKDPVCGTHVAEATALQAGGYYFCSEECRTQFVKVGAPRQAETPPRGVEHR